MASSQIDQFENTVNLFFFADNGRQDENVKVKYGVEQYTMRPL